MTKKDYVLIAEAINRVVDGIIGNDIAVQTIKTVVDELDLSFRKDNELYQSDKFRDMALRVN